MANEKRSRTNLVAGALSAGLASGDTTMDSAGLADLAVIDATNHAAITIFAADGNGRILTKEIVYVTAHTASATSATIVRGREGTSAQTWASAATWVHAPTTRDLPRFRRTVYRHSANYTTTSATFASLDATNLPALPLTLAIGDVVRCSLSAVFGHSTTGAVTRLDWLIDQPTSADTTFRTLNGGGGAGMVELGTNATDCNTFTILGLFTASEAGLHTFIPQFAVSGGTGSVINQGANSAAVAHLVENLGAETG